jgi:hypothetical protein
MQGHNSINLCPAEMIQAVQYYLDNVLLKTKAKVTEIKQIADRSGRFEIKLVPPTETEDGRDQT